mgnify:FL=1
MAAYPNDNRISARAVLTQGIEAALNTTSDHKELRAAPIDGPARATSSNGRPRAAGLAEAVQHDGSITEAPWWASELPRLWYEATGRTIDFFGLFLHCETASSILRRCRVITARRGCPRHREVSTSSCCACTPAASASVEPTAAKIWGDSHENSSRKTNKRSVQK